MCCTEYTFHFDAPGSRAGGAGPCSALSHGPCRRQRLTFLCNSSYMSQPSLTMKRRPAITVSATMTPRTTASSVLEKESGIGIGTISPQDFTVAVDDWG